MSTSPEILPLGDRALVLRFGRRIDVDVNRRVLAAWRQLVPACLPGVIDLVPAYASLTVLYDWQQLPEAGRDRPWHWLAGEVDRVLADSVGDTPESGRQVEVPVCYGGEHGPDLAAVAEASRLSEAEVVRRHAGADYQVAFLGFRPGFPYLLGLDPALALPRLDTPRPQIAAGSVGIGGAQTGVYPVAGPGGWRLIGRTPLSLFDPTRDPPMVLAPGDRVRFVPMARAEFEHSGGDGAGPAFSADADAAALAVVHPGIHSSLQDLGRPGWRHLGIGAGGASDPIAAGLANALVGNPDHAAVLELTLRGPELHVLRPIAIALAGAGMNAEVDHVSLPFGQPVFLNTGMTLRFKPTGLGARAWLAVAGGFAAPRWLGSVSADFDSGLLARTLQAGDRLALDAGTAAPPLSDRASIRSGRWWVEARAEIDAPMILRYLRDDDAEPAWHHELPARVWRVGHAADRTGLRLDGVPLSVAAQPHRISAGVLAGTVQVPSDGLPIVLGADGQTTGGYPVVGHVIEADLPRLAQLKPGDLVWLQPTSLTEAQQARAAQAALIARTRLAIRYRIRDGLA